MDRYYKIHRDSTTGQKLSVLLTQFEEYSKLKEKFTEKYNIESTYICSYYWIELGEVVFKTIPENIKENWKKGSVKDGYVLKAKPKDLTLKKDWDELIAKRIKRSEIDRIIGGKDQFYQAGFSFYNSTYFLVIVDEPGKYDFPQDVVEISNIEYLALKNKQ